jgi:hypothetical protein
MNIQEKNEVQLHIFLTPTLGVLKATALLTPVRSRQDFSAKRLGGLQELLWTR